MFTTGFLPGVIDFTLTHLDRWCKAESVDTSIFVGPGKSYIQAEPMGNVLILGTWNYPFNTTLLAAISAIAAGNTIILKPSEVAVHS